MTSFLLFGLASLTGLLALASIKGMARERMRRCLVAYKLSFPRNLEVDGVVSAMAGLSGLLQPWWRRWLAAPFVSLEIHASSTGIRHYLIVPEGWLEAACNILQASLPSVRFEAVPVPEVKVRTAAEYRLTDNGRSLIVDAATQSARLLANLQPLDPKQAVVIQWLVTPHGPVAPAKTSPKSTSNDSVIFQSQMDGEAIGALKKKQALPLLLCSGRIGVQASTGWSELNALRRAESAWHETRAPGVHFTRRMLLSRWVSKSMAARQTPFSVWPSTLNSEELASVIGWPVEVMALPGLSLNGSRQIPPSPVVPSTGTVLADSTYPGNERPMAIDLQARLRHVHVIGPTGTGKSTLLVSMAESDMKAGRGLIVIDPRADLVQAILERVPARRRRDVIIFDPADDGRPVGINPLRSAKGTSGEVVVENLVGMFKSLYKSSWGPRLDDILRAALLTLAGVEGATLCEVPLILSDANYRQRIIGQLDDPIGLESFWGWYEALSDAERQTVIAPVLNKVRAFTMRPRIRGIIGQDRPGLDFTQAMAKGQIVLCSLASGLLGDEAASLLGALIVAEIWHAATARAGLPKDRRPPVMTFIDEFQNVVHLPTPMASMLAEARGHGLGLTLAHQDLSQLGPEVQSAVLSNARSRVVFQSPAADARVLTREMGGMLTADDLQGLGAYEVACQLFAGGSTQAPATGRTRPLEPGESDSASLRSESRERFGTDTAEIELAIRTRQMGSAPSAIGRKSRPRGSS